MLHAFQKKTAKTTKQDIEKAKARLKNVETLMLEIENYVTEAGLAQTEAAKRLKTHQSRLNDVLQGRIEKCTIDRLVTMLAAVGRSVEIKVNDAA